MGYNDTWRDETLGWFTLDNFKCIALSGIVKLIDEYGGGSYLVNFANFYQEYAKHHISSIVRERFGPKCHRIFAIVLAKNMIEQKQVQCAESSQMWEGVGREDCIKVYPLSKIA